MRKSRAQAIVEEVEGLLRERGPIQCEAREVTVVHREQGPREVLRPTGDTHNLEPAALFLYRERLPGSGEVMRDFPIYCQLLFLSPPELGTAAEVFLPLQYRPNS